MMSCERLGVSSGTTRSAPSSPTPIEGSRFKSSLGPSLTVRIMKIAVSTAGRSSRAILMLLLVVVTTVVVCEDEKVVSHVLASLATNWTKTFPKQRLRKTNAALMRRTISNTAGMITMAASVNSGDMIDSYYKA